MFYVRVALPVEAQRLPGFKSIKFGFIKKTVTLKILEENEIQSQVPTLFFRLWSGLLKSFIGDGF